MLRPHAVFFDLDNTLTHRQRSIQRYTARFEADFAGSRIGAAAESSGGAALMTCIAEADCGGYLPAGGPHTSVREAVSHAIVSRPEWRGLDREKVMAHWVSEFHASAEPMPGAHALIGALATAGVQLGIVSNGAGHSRRAVLHALAFEATIPHLICSGESGVAKPDPRIFEMAARRAGCAVEDCWFVGDHPLNDVEGARAVGMSAIWLRGFHAWPASLVRHAHAVDHLDEVLPILMRAGLCNALPPAASGVS